MVREAADVWERSPDRQWGWGLLGPGVRSSSGRSLVAWVGLQRAWHSLSLGPPGPLPSEGQLQRERVCVQGCVKGVESVRCI